jgi:pimeloyl-ACP methyl ester carboxylesterase
VPGGVVNVETLPGEPEHPTLVFLHEALGNAALWRGFPAALCAAVGWPGLVPERLGFGASDPEAAPRGADYLHRGAEELAALVAALGLEAVVPFGHSDGGTIALLFAAAQPERCGGLVTEAAHVLVEEETLDGVRATVAAYESADLARRLAAHHGERTEGLFRAWSETWLAPWFRDWDIRAELAAVRAPVLALQGADDAYGSPAQLSAIAGGVAGPVRTVLLPDCGHSPHREARDRVLALASEFLRSLGG